MRITAMRRTADYYKYKVTVYRELERAVYIVDNTEYFDSLTEARAYARTHTDKVTIHRLNEYTGDVIRELQTPTARP